MSDPPRRRPRTAATPASPGGRRRPGDLSEGRRTLVCTVAATAATAVIETIWLAASPGLRPYGFAVGFVVAWTIFTVLHLGLTRAAYGGLDAAQLRRRLAEDAPARRSRSTRADRLRHGLLDGWWRTEAPSWSVQVSVLSLAVVVWIIAVPALHGSVALLAWTLAMVAGSWADIAVMFAVHYARADLVRPGLAFPGEEPRRFTDYAYLALAVQATFGTTDVAVTTTAMRRTVMVHTALAFVFNTVIIALIVSLLLGTIG